MSADVKGGAKGKIGAKVALGLYAFVLFFEPPFTPMSQIYLTGAVTLGLLFFEYRRGSLDEVMRLAHLDKTLVAMIIASAYLLTVTLIDLALIETTDVTDNRLRCFNQLFVLTGIQLAGVLYVLAKARQFGFSLRDVLMVALIAGAVQGLCVLAAYGMPQIRDMFLHFADDIYENPWMYERRGFGFSSTLLDTFGYGIGVLCAVLLFSPLKSRIANVGYFALMVLCTFLNSRTGLVVALVAVCVKLLLPRRGVARAAWAVILLMLFMAFLEFAPTFVQMGSRSPEVTVRWVSSALNDFYLLVTGGADVTEVQFVDDIAPLPSHLFEFLLGSGHSIYDTSVELGFRSDIGYYNIVWTYGFIGAAFYYGFMLWLALKAYRGSSSWEMKALAVFLVVAFFVVQLKGNVLGASPGISVTYYCLFSILYFNSVDGERIKATRSVSFGGGVSVPIRKSLRRGGAGEFR